MSWDEIAALAIVVPFVGVLLMRLIAVGVLKMLGQSPKMDQETIDRGASLLLGQSLRQAFVWTTQPIVWVLSTLRVSPNVLTTVSFLGSIVAALILGSGRLALGGVVALVAVSLDFFDGRLARAAGSGTPAGSFLDSTLDRCSEVALFCGAAMVFRDELLTLAVTVAGLGASLVIPYARAKAEALGVGLTVGLMQRPERVVLFCIGAVADPFLGDRLALGWFSHTPVFAFAIWTIAILSTVTAAQRVVTGFRRLAVQRD